MSYGQSGLVYTQQKEVTEQDTFLQLRSTNHSKFLVITGGVGGLVNTQIWMRSKDFETNYWCFYGDSLDSLIFIPQRRVQIFGFLFNQEKDKNDYKLKYKYKVDDGEYTEEFKPETRSYEDHITVPNVDEKWKFYEFHFKETGCPNVIVEEGQKFRISAIATQNGQLRFHYVERRGDQSDLQD